MSDLLLAACWLAVLGSGLGACVFLHQHGVATTYVRDLLHVGSGLWVLGWPTWRGALVPIAIAAGATLATALVPWLARRSAAAARVEHSFSGGDERWSGLTLYAASFALLTAFGLGRFAFAAAAGLLALSLGDGIGGFVGRRFGAHHYRIPWSKPKSLEGSVGVALAAAAGVALAGVWFDRPLSLGLLAALGVGAATAEALSPRGGDNVVVPLAVFGLAALAS